MASCITSQVGNSYCPQLKLEVSVDSSYSSNATKAKLDWKLQYVAHGYSVSTSNSKSYTAKINGTTVASGSYAIGGKKEVNNIATGSVYIDRKTSSQEISFSCSMDFGITWNGSYLGSKSASGTITLSKKTSYTVSYNVNGGSGSVSSQTKWHGTNLTLSTTKPTKTGYSFKNWNTNSGGTGTTYSSGGTYSANASATLYAQYTAKTYTVSYNANGGSNAPSSQTKTYGVNLTLSSTKPTRTNYTFKGWATSSTGSVAYASGGTYSSNSSVTLYAVWALAYTKPRITNCTINRCNTDGTTNDEGTNVKIKFNWETDYEVSRMILSYKKSTDSSYTDTVLTDNDIYGISGTNDTLDIYTTSNAFSTEYSYDFKITVADSNGSTVVSRSIPAMVFTVDFLAGGKGVAFGKPATSSNTLDIAFTVKTEKNITMAHNTYLQQKNSSGSNCNLIGCTTDNYARVGGTLTPELYTTDTSKQPKVNLNGTRYNIFHAGNGPKSGDWFSGTAPIVGSTGYMKIGKYLDFHDSDTTTNDYSTRIKCNGDTMNTITLPTTNGTVALTSDITPIDVTHTLNSSNCSNVSGVYCKYVPALKIVYFKAYYTAGTSLATGGNRILGTIASGYRPSTQFALSSFTVAGASSAYISSAGEICIRPYTTISSDGKITIAGFWFVS